MRPTRRERGKSLECGIREISHKKKEEKEKEKRGLNERSTHCWKILKKLMWKKSKF